MAREVKQWITIDGQHIPIFEGQSKQDVVNSFIAKKNEDTKEKQIAKNKAESDRLNGKPLVKVAQKSQDDGDGWERTEDTYVLKTAKGDIEAEYDWEKKKWVIYNGGEYVGVAHSIKEMKEKARRLTPKYKPKEKQESIYGGTSSPYVRGRSWIDTVMPKK